MPDTVLTLFLVAAVFLVADVLVAGGAMTMSAMSAMTGAVAHPLVAGALVLLVAALVLTLGGTR